MPPQAFTALISYYSLKKVPMLQIGHHNQLTFQVLLAKKQ